MSNQARNLVNMVARGAMNQSSPATAAQVPQASTPPSMTLAQMLGGNLYARQVADNSMSPLAMLQQFRATGQMPTSPGSGVMFGQMGQQMPQQMTEMIARANQAKGGK